MSNPFAAELAKRNGASGDNPFAAELVLREDDRDSEGDTPGTTIYEGASQFAGGFNQGLSRYTEFPENVARFVSQPFREEKTDWNTVGPVTNYLRDGVPEARTASERALRNVGDVVGANVPYAALSLGAAPVLSQAAKALGPTANVVQRGVGAMFEAISNSPGKAAVGETIASLGQGGGHAAAQAIDPDNEALDMGLQFAGGVSPAALAYTPAMLAMRGGRFITEKFSPAAQRDAARNQVAKSLGGEITPEVSQSISDTQGLRREIPGFNPSLAEATGSDSLIATQRNIESNATGAKLEKLGARRRGNQEAIDAYASRSAPGGLSDPELVIDTAAGRVDNLRRAIAQEREGLDQFGRSQALGIPSINRSDVGQSLRSAMADTQNEARVRMSRLADQLGIGDTDVTVPFAQFQDEIRGQGARGAFADKANTPAVFNDILNYGKRSDDSMRVLLRDLRYGNGDKPKSLMSFIRSKGGLKDDAGELRARDFGSRGGLVNNRTGRPLDDMANSATEAGYFPGKERATPDDLLAALDDEARGRPVYSMADQETVAKHRELDAFRTEMDRAGINLNLPDHEIVRRMNFESGTPGNASVTFNDLMVLRSRVSDDLRDAVAGANPSAKKVRDLTDLGRRVDTFIETATQQADPALAGKYKEFRQAYKLEYIDRFNQGAAFKVRQRDGRGFYQVPDERVADQFLKDASGAKQFKRTFGEGAPETEALESAALDDLRQAAVREGEINPTALQAWMRKNAAVLDEFPNLRSRVSNIEDATTAMRDRNDVLTMRERRIGQAMLSRQVNSVAKGKDPQAVIDAAVKNPNLMGQLVRSVKKSPDAMQALQRNLWEGAQAHGSPDDLLSYLKDNGPSLKQVLEPGHLQSLETIARATKQIQRVPAPAGRAIDTNPMQGIERAMGTGINQVASRAFAAESGRTSWRMVAIDLFGRFSRSHSRAEAARLMEEALYNPKVAKDIANSFASKRVDPATAKRLNTWLFTVGQERE